MIDELRIETALVEHLGRVIDDFAVERYSSDIVDVIVRAKQNVNGLIEVSHSASPIEYEPFDEFASSYKLDLEFAITILVNDNGEGRDDMIRTFQRVRSALQSFEYPGCALRIIRHQIHPQKFPDMLEGVHIAELIVSLSGIYFERGDDEYSN